MHQFGIFEFHSKKDVEYLKYLDNFNKIKNRKTIIEPQNRINELSVDRFNWKFEETLICFIIIFIGNMFSILVFIIEIFIRLVIDR
jgi:hypothetical protein